MRTVKLCVAAGLLLAAASAHSQELAPLTPAQLGMEAGFALALAADRSQTLQIRGFCNGRTACTMHETNPLLGRDPSPAAINRYFLAAAAGHVLVTALMSESQRAVWQASSLVLELAVVGRNKRLGLRVSF